MNYWLWLQTQLEIGPVQSLKSLENLLGNKTLSDDQSLTCLEILMEV